MADETQEKKEAVDVKKLALEFRKTLRNPGQLKAAVTEGLKSKNALIRALAVKAAFKLKDHNFIKQNVLGLIKSEKSKKVLRAISGKITRRELYKKVRASRVAKKFGMASKTEEAPHPLLQKPKK